MENNMWFCCDRCNNVDHMKSTPPAGNAELLCYRCQFGSWHNHFSEETYDPSIHECCNKEDSQCRGNSFMGGPAMP